MPRLIHLNGPPGVGKSTVAERYTADHPGTLLADIDVLRTRIGGWTDDFEGAGELARPIAHAMIGAHLSGGNDVVMPQFLSDAEEVADFERVAAGAGGRFIEIALLADADIVVQRFRQRRSTSDDRLSTVISAFVDGAGGEPYLRKLHEEFMASLAERPDARVVQSEPGDEQATYQAVALAISDCST